MKFIDILNQLLEEEKLKKLKDDLDKLLLAGKPVSHSILYPWIQRSKFFYFFTYISYAGIIELETCIGTDICNDLLISIGNSVSPKKNKIIKLWKEIKGECQLADWEISEIAIWIAQYHLNQYKNTENDRVLSHWANSNFLFTPFAIAPEKGAADEDPKRSLFEKDVIDVVCACQEQLGICLRGSLLVSIRNLDILCYLLENNACYDLIVFYNLNGYEWGILMNIILLDCFENVQYIEMSDDDDNENLFPFDSTFDVCIYQAPLPQQRIFTEVPKLINNKGMCITYLENLKDVVSEMKSDSYSFPIIFEGNGYAVVCKNEQQSEERIRYAWMKDYPSQDIRNCIETHSATTYYQELDRKDFLYARSYSFQGVKRAVDQVHFIWKPISEILMISNDAGEPVYNDNIAFNQIVRVQALSNNPFTTNLPSDYLLHNFKNEPTGECLDEDCWIKRHADTTNIECDFQIPLKYDKVFTDLLYNKHKENPEALKFYEKLCCRILKKPSLLYSQLGYIGYIDASEQSPVCFEKYFFFEEDDYYYSSCQLQIDVIDINQNYDKDFIIYQLLTSGWPKGNMLVAPTKEEQHTYYLEKRRERLTQYYQVIDEMKRGRMKRISQTPVYFSKIGLHNFRKYVHLPLLNLGAITFLVGGNNSGKSTFVKGLLLIFENLKTMNIGGNENYFPTFEPKFRLDTDLCHALHIGTFERALNRSAAKREIVFSTSVAFFNLSLTVHNEGGADDATVVPISSITITDTQKGCSFNFDFRQKTMVIKGLTVSGEATKDIEIELDELKDHLSSNSIVAMLRNLSKNTSINELTKGKLMGKLGFISELADELEGVIANCKIEYIYAHGASQKILYNYDDKNDYMALTLHEFKSERIDDGSTEHAFTCKWMEKFDIGIDYSIQFIGGEAYTIKIKDKEGRMAYLADKGMGTNQLMILFLRVAIIIHRYNTLKDMPFKPIIIIEEPEQNLHPAFQSLLADFFREVNADYGFRFIVETHSEYIIRKTQVMVANAHYASQEELENQNPFKVYYFPNGAPPYDMGYRMDGKFSEQFGKGFFDESANLIFQII